MRLPRSLAVRIGAVAATAAIAVTGATTAASAATVASAAGAIPAAHRIPTALSISHSLPRVRPLQITSVVDGHLTAGRFNVRSQRVWLLRQGRSGIWFVTQTKLTGRYGHVFFLVHLGTKPVRFRLVFRGSPNFARSVSAIDTIR
jgi:hypothetical protein